MPNPYVKLTPMNIKQKAALQAFANTMRVGLSVHVPYQLMLGQPPSPTTMAVHAALAVGAAAASYLMHETILEADLAATLDEMCAARNFPLDIANVMTSQAIREYEQSRKLEDKEDDGMSYAVVLNAAAKGINESCHVDYHENPEPLPLKFTDHLKNAGVAATRFAGFGNNIQGGVAPFKSRKNIGQLECDVNQLFIANEIDDPEAQNFYQTQAKNYFNQAKRIGHESDNSHPLGSALLRVQRDIEGGTFQPEVELQPARATI